MSVETMLAESGVALPQILWQAPAVAVLVITVVFIAMALRKRKKQAFENIASFLQGKVGGNSFLENYFFSGAYKGRALTIKYEPGGKNHPDCLVISLEGPLFILDLQVSREDFLRDTLEALGLMKDIESGDPAFDARFHAVSSVSDLAPRYLSGQEVRGRISALFDAGAFSLELVPRGAAIPGLIRLKKRSPDLAAELTKQALLPQLDALDVLCSEKNGKEFFGSRLQPETFQA